MSYDKVLYPDRVFPQTHPDRLATIATLFGRTPTPPAEARVLELGCGAGANLIAMAHAAPGAEFVGVDNAREPIRRARERALPNTHFHELGLEAYEPDAPFDYVIAHGVFSWVPAAIRDALLALAGRVLAPEGVAYVSYNALPGGRLRGMLRAALAVHVQDRDVVRARQFLQLLIAANDADPELTPTLARAAREVIDKDDAFLFHDVLAPDNEPFSVERFVTAARTHGLDYLCEAQFSETQTGALPPAFRNVVESIGDAVRRETYLDILKERRFRQTLLMRPGLRGEPSADGLWVSADLRVEGNVFHGPGTARVEVEDPVLAAALHRAIEGPIPVGDLSAEFLRLYAANLVELHFDPKSDHGGRL